MLKIRFKDIYGQYEKNKLTCEEAAEILGISISSFYRKRQIYEEEGTFSSFQDIYETIKQEGVFCSFYTDRGSHYFYTPEEGGKVDKYRLLK